MVISGPKSEEGQGTHTPPEKYGASAGQMVNESPTPGVEPQHCVSGSYVTPGRQAVASVPPPVHSQTLPFWV